VHVDGYVNFSQPSHAARPQQDARGGARRAPRKNWWSPRCMRHSRGLARRSRSSRARAVGWGGPSSHHVYRSQDPVGRTEAFFYKRIRIHVKIKEKSILLQLYSYLYLHTLGALLSLIFRRRSPMIMTVRTMTVRT
jgi:hypothetical protein